jgi:hypothetical protein
MADYYFRDDLQAEKDRLAKAQGTTLSPAPTPQQVQTTATPAAAPAGGNGVYTAIGQAAGQAKPAENPFDSFRTALDAQDPFKAQIKQGVTDTLANPAAAADEAAGLARDRLSKSQQVEAERRRQQAGMAYGGAQTGQVGRAMDDYATEAMLQTQDQEGQLRADRLAAIERNRNAAIGQGTTLIGQDQQAKLAEAQMAQNERLQDKQIASTEKMTYAGLELDKTKFEAADANAKKGLSLEESAQALQKLGMDKDEAYRYAELGQQKAIADKEIESREKLAYAQIGSTERLQASQQIFQGEQAKMDRELEKLLSNDRIQAQFQLSDLDHQFQEKMQANGFVQEKDIEAMRADLQTKLQATGIAADQAKQIADQKFSEMMAGRDQAFEEKMTNIKQTWASGERVATQDFQTVLQASDQKHEEIMANLQSTLRLDEAKNAQVFQTSFQQMQNDFTLYRDKLGYDQETATRLATQSFQESMQKAGFSHDEAMQGTQLAWQSVENDRNRASTEMMSAASLAQQDSHFMQELQQRYSFNEGDLRLRATELGAQMKLMGLQGEQLQNAIADSKVNSAMQIAALGMEIGDGSPDAMKPFVEQLGNALSTYFKGQGVDISAGSFTSALAGNTTTAAPGTVPATPKAGADAFSSLLDKVGSFTSPEAKESVRNYAVTIANQFNSATVAQKVGGIKDVVGGANLDAAIEKLKAAGASDAAVNSQVSRERQGNWVTGMEAQYSATPAFIDFTLYNTLISKGLDPASAKQALTSLIGTNPDRLQHAMTLIKYVENGGKT